MTGKENLFPLKMLVFSMALLLLGGVIFLGTVVFHKAGEQQAECAPATLDLSGEGTVESVESEGREVQIVTRRKDGVISAISVNRCNGEVTSRLDIRSKK